MQGKEKVAGKKTGPSVYSLRGGDSFPPRGQKKGKKTNRGKTLLDGLHCHGRSGKRSRYHVLFFVKKSRHKKGKEEVGPGRPRPILRSKRPIVREKEKEPGRLRHLFGRGKERQEERRGMPPSEPKEDVKGPS